MCDSPFYVDNPQNWKQEKVPVPCGKCVPCRRKRVNDWVFRMQKEEERSSSSYFVTLTYDTTTVPISPNGFMTLSKRDCQLFMKRLRKLQPDVKIKYYLVGEYGSQNKRPHYHAIIFNIIKTDYIVEAWQLGSVHIGAVSGASIGYTCKYIDKPARIPEHRNDDRQKEFSLMSKGMGENYLTPAMRRYHLADLNRNYVILDGGVKSSLPKYYRDKIFSDADKEKQREFIRKLKEKEKQDLQVTVSSLYPGMHVDTYQSLSRQGRTERDNRKQNPRTL